uniref:Uncharacterized protein n=1 Tax=Vitis vinifera TaxID=29760 RepID=F6I1J1_VITVI
MRFRPDIHIQASPLTLNWILRSATHDVFYALHLMYEGECMEGVHGIDIWNVGFPWMHDHWRWNGYHIEIGRYVLGELKERWL